MKKHIKYPKIKQFRNIVADINRSSTFVRMDGDTPIFDNNAKKPILTFTGTVKLHGTNAGVCYNDQEGIWVQSRENVITTEKDNAGFAFFIESRKDIIKSLFQSIVDTKDIDTGIYTISIFGEWAGKGIQKGVGISQLNKSFYIFGAKISKPQDEEFNSYWIDSSEVGIYDGDSNIFNIYDYPTYKIDIDFNMPQLAQNELVKMTEAVEEECPVSKAFGIDNGLGEGIVWSCLYKDSIHRFKVKGEKHSVSKVKKLANVDVERLNSIKEFVDYAVTQSRFDQARENVFERAGDVLIIDIKNLGSLIRWVINDITSEEMDTLIKNNLEPKDVNKYISTRVREMFFKLEI